MTEFEVEVLQIVKVTLDETKFTPEFMEEFRASFFPFEELTEHAEHIAQLAARDIFGGFPDEFIEGYGPANGMGIQAHVKDVETRLIDA